MYTTFRVEKEQAKKTKGLLSIQHFKIEGERGGRDLGLGSRGSRIREGEVGKRGEGVVWKHCIKSTSYINTYIYQFYFLELLSLQVTIRNPTALRLMI